MGIATAVSALRMAYQSVGTSKELAVSDVVFFQRVFRSAIFLGLSTSHQNLWKNKTSETANSLLTPTDWYAIRKADTGVAIPTDWSDWRQSIRVAASTKQTAIDAVTTVAELETYITTNTGADSDYPVWPLNPDQVAALPTPEAGE